MLPEHGKSENEISSCAANGDHWSGKSPVVVSILLKWKRVLEDVVLKLVWQGDEGSHYCVVVLGVS